MPLEPLAIHRETCCAATRPTLPIWGFPKISPSRNVTGCSSDGKCLTRSTGLTSVTQATILQILRPLDASPPPRGMVQGPEEPSKTYLAFRDVSCSLL